MGRVAIDPRDGAILEPLPVRAGIIRRAKASAVAILGAAVAIGSEACGSAGPKRIVKPTPRIAGVVLVSLIDSN